MHLEASSAAVSQPRVPAPNVTLLSITGMTCANCVRHAREALQAVAGVANVNVSLEGGRADVRWLAGSVPDVHALVHAVEQAGYEAHAFTGDQAEAADQRVAGWQLNLWLGVPVTVLLMAGEWLLGIHTHEWFPWTAFGLAGIVQIFAGARFYRGAWLQLRAGSSNMDTLVALGSTTAFGYSAWSLLAGQGGHLYFLEAVSIITLISAGHWLESRVSAKASGALRNLLQLAPAQARRLDRDGAEQEVPVVELATGDLLVLRPGDQVPVDGKVVEGNSSVNESMLTGESVPVDKTPASPLYAGTANINGRLVMQITATGEETALAHIIAAVRRAQDSRANIQRLGDQVSNVFVPVVVGLALLAGLWWGIMPESAAQVHQWVGRFLWPAHLPDLPLSAAILVAVSVLVIACPCAMGLATPAAIMAGANAAAQRGILIRDGVALEKAGNITAVVFDKTGTLTAGQPVVDRVWDSQSGQAQPRLETDNPALKLAVALASASSHPVSRAVAALAPDAGVGMADWQEVAGSGVQARTLLEAGEGAWARLGSIKWLAAQDINLGPGKTFLEEATSDGATVIGLAIGPRLEALFAVRDTVKPGAEAVIRQLRKQRLKTFLVTGDNARTAAAIALKAGIRPEHVFSEVRPEQKAEFVAQLQAQRERVAFVGDGINDAPALERADLGIAVSRASDVAREAADIILLKSEIEAVPESLGLARATLATIKQNLFWAFFYNALGVPLAALGFMSPILCAAAMGLSDLVVIGNALRLRNWKLPV